FINENNILGYHYFLFFGGASSDIYPIPKANNIYVLNTNDHKSEKFICCLKKFYMADKIILHGLFNPFILKFLYLQPWLLSKCYWVMWGADLYCHILEKKKKKYKLHEKWRKRVIRKMGGLVTYIKGDCDLARKWYGSQGKYYGCFMYPSNLYKEYALNSKQHCTINIQVGNSADPTNNHIEVFKKLKKYKNKNIKIFVPLSYGDQKYAKNVIVEGKNIFGDKFVPLVDFMPFDQYLELLSEIDIAIFNHKRQQAMGNIITLLGLGKKVYMRNDITPWSMFEYIGITVFDVANVEIELLCDDVNKENKQIVKKYFSEENLTKQWGKIIGNSNE
ncbi:MAG: TDP-N-acetylfucosamine:lipid II N-acetylfucosaminyltransferase, partial [Gammaproteobacteria bacterium]|nr:TDP-N-acetylfucosamine:lipid II N-acetylfucosaminyltransferase [Gammaproteobacteria bacterium]